MPETVPKFLALVLRRLRENELDEFKRKLAEASGKAFSISDPLWTRLERLGPKDLVGLLLNLYGERHALVVAIRVLRAMDRLDLAERLAAHFDVEEKKNPEEFENFFSCLRCPRKDRAINIRPETILDPEGGYNIYRLNCTESGSFHCCITDFIFDVRAPVTLTYHFDSWPKHLQKKQRKDWVIVGPLLDIQADPEKAVAAIHVPHFLCLEGKGHSEIYIAHFVKEGMSLEKPDKVKPFHLKLKNPTFSPRGAVLRKGWFKRKIKVHAVALLYQDLRIPILKFHLYLLPNDSSLKNAVHEHELNYDSQRVRKPPETIRALTIGSHFFLEKIIGVVVHPEKLEFKYLSTDMEHQYLELFADHMEEALWLYLLEKKKNELVWAAYIRREELHAVKVQKQNASQNTDGPVVETKFCSNVAVNRQTHTPLAAHVTPETTEKHQPSSPGMHFIEQHREELIGRTSNVEGVLDMLYGTVLDREQYQKILSRNTPQDKMRELYMLVPSWNRFCKNQLYEALKVKQKFLIDDLEGR